MMEDVTIEDKNTELITAVDPVIVEAPNSRARTEDVTNEEIFNVLVTISPIMRVDAFMVITLAISMLILDAIMDDVLYEFPTIVEHVMEDAFTLLA
jgi:hypothetical protein